MEQRSYEDRGYGDIEIGFGEKPGIVVVDFQRGFTEPEFEAGGAPLIVRAVENTARLLDVARACNVPVASCNISYGNQREIPHWKVRAVREELWHGTPAAELDPRIHDPDYDYTVTKSGPSIFFGTPVAAFFTKERVDTLIVTGCVTSGCIRASVIDSFSHGFRTIVPEDCVGDQEEQPHHDNLRDVGRRYADISDAEACIAFIEDWRGRNRD